MSDWLFWKDLQKEGIEYTLDRPCCNDINRIKISAPEGNYTLIDKALQMLTKHNAYLLTLVGVDERPLQRGFAVYQVYALSEEKTIVEIRLQLNGEKPVYPSTTLVFPSAHWLERELKDFLGIVPEGHPDLRKVAVHPDWPADVFPLRKDFLAGTKVPRVKGDFDFCTVEGEGLYQVPVGPIHAGIIEPGHFRFFTFGEDVINLQAQLFYTHRGVEKAAEGKNFADVALIAERICGVCSASHAAAYAQAIESLAGVEIPKRAAYIRTMLLEMERLYNHVGDIGNMCAGVGFAYGISRGAILKEKIMRMNKDLTGHRYLRGIIIPGGVKRDLNPDGLMIWLDGIEKELEELIQTILSSDGLLDRTQTTGVLSYKDAFTLGAVGPAARASGVDRDLRRDLPYAGYADFDFYIPVQEDGDVHSRLVQRIEEASESIAILRQVLQIMPEDNLLVSIPDLPPYQTAIGYTESARGADIHWVMSGEGNTIYRYMARSASHCNWPVLPLTVPGNIVPDFPLINKSFELCYACLDR